MALDFEFCPSASLTSLLAAVDEAGIESAAYSGILKVWCFLIEKQPNDFPSYVCSDNKHTCLLHVSHVFVRYLFLFLPKNIFAFKQLESNS